MTKNNNRLPEAFTWDNGKVTGERPLSNEEKRAVVELVRELAKRTRQEFVFEKISVDAKQADIASRRIGCRTPKKKAMRKYMYDGGSHGYFQHKVDGDDTVSSISFYNGDKNYRDCQKGTLDSYLPKELTKQTDADIHLFRMLQERGFDITLLSTSSGGYITFEYREMDEKDAVPFPWKVVGRDSNHAGTIIQLACRNHRLYAFINEDKWSEQEGRGYLFADLCDLHTCENAVTEFESTPFKESNLDDIVNTAWEYAADGCGSHDYEVFEEFLGILLNQDTK